MAKSKFQKNKNNLIRRVKKLSRLQKLLLVVIVAGAGFLIYRSFASSGPYSTRFTVYGNDTGAPQCGTKYTAKEGYSVAFAEDVLAADPAKYCGKYIHVTTGPYAGRYMQIVDGCGGCEASKNGGNPFARIDVYCNYPEHDPQRKISDYEWQKNYFYPTCTSRGISDISGNTTYLTDTAGGGIPAGPHGFTYCATEGSPCTFPGARRDVAYGDGDGHWYYRSSIYDHLTCANSTFAENSSVYLDHQGNGDPAVGHKKYCYTYHLPSGYSLCASENNFCAFDGLDKVVYGANGHVSNRVGYSASDVYWPPQTNIATESGIWCSNSNFNDLASGYTKYCYRKEVSQSSYSCSTHPTVGYGYTTTGTCVSRIQYILRKTARYESNSGEDPNTINSSFGTSTYNALKNFQGSHYRAGTATKLVADGVAGQYTWPSLEGQCSYINSHNRYNIKC